MEKLLWLLLLVACGSRGDTLWLKNGDRMSGKILFMDSRAIAFKSAAAGQVKIKREKVRALSTSRPVDLKGDVPGQMISSLIRVGENNTLLLDDGSAVTLTQIDSLVRPSANGADWHWEGHLDLALDMKKDDDEETDNITTKLDTRLFNLTWRHMLKADYEYETEDSELSERNYSLEYSLDYFIHRPWFLRLETRADRDYLDYDQSAVSVGAGPGYQFWDNTQGHFSLNLQYVRYRLSFDVDGPAVVKLHSAGLGWDFEQNWLTPDLELFSYGQILFPEEYDIELIAHSESGLRYHLTGHINLSWRIEYDEFRQDSFTTQTRRYLAGIGVKW